MSTLVWAAPAFAQPPQIVADSGQLLPGYGEAAALVIRAPVIVDATIHDAILLKGPQAANVAVGHARFFVEADVGALIRGTAAIPQRVGYVVEAPLDSRGKPPKLKKLRVLLFARPVAGQPDRIQLVTTEAQRLWSAQLDGLVRTITRDVIAPDAPPAVTGIGNVFHVPGSLPGEGETQIFLSTDNGAPISLVVLRRPGEQRRWAVSLGEIVDDAAGPPPRNTLLWYRLACGLPARLPEASLAAEEPGNAAVAREDYDFVLAQLGRCANR